VLSSRVIPGNEKSIYRVIDHLCRREANVIYDDGESGLIHVSGHGSQEEMRLMINLLRPKFFIPVHGITVICRSTLQLAKTPAWCSRRCCSKMATFLKWTPTPRSRQAK